MKHIVYGTLAALLLVACSSDEELTLSEVVSRAENPAVYLYIEDVDGRDLVADGQSVSVWCEETGLPLSHAIEPGRQALPWGGEGQLLAVTPATPFHAPDDPEYVYTLNPTTIVAVGSTQIRLSRTFDYNLRRYEATGGGRAVDVTYMPTETTVCGSTMAADTVHIIVENGWPSVRVEGSELLLEMRFPPVDDALAALPLEQDSEGVWHSDLLDFRLLFSGRVIAKPAERVTTTLHHGTTPDDDYLALQVRLRLPYIYSGGWGVDYFSYDYLVTSPLLFGNMWEHRVALEMYDMGRGPRISQLQIGPRWVENATFTATDPYTVVVDYRDVELREQ